MAKVTYLTGATTQFGYEFTAGEPTEVTDPKHIAKFAGNPAFAVEGGDSGTLDGDEASGTPTTSDNAEQRDENGDTLEMAAMRGQFDRAFASVKDDLATAEATIETLTGQLATANAKIAELGKPGASLKAEHHGGGKFNITNGETVLAKGLSKADADAFNAMSDVEKAEYVKTNS